MRSPACCSGIRCPEPSTSAPATTSTRTTLLDSSRTISDGARTSASTLACATSSNRACANATTPWWSASIATGRFPIQAPGLDLRGGLMYAGVDGYPEHQGDPSTPNFGPRAGIAWSLDSKTVVRGGYGLFWAPPQIAQAFDQASVGDARVHGDDDLHGQHRWRIEPVQRLLADQSLPEWRRQPAGRRRRPAHRRRWRHRLHRSVVAIRIRAPVFDRCEARADGPHVGVGRLPRQPQRASRPGWHHRHPVEHQSARPRLLFTRQRACRSWCRIRSSASPSSAPGLVQPRSPAASCCGRTRSSPTSSPTASMRRAPATTR